jgi:hypothetical protein
MSQIFSNINNAPTLVDLAVAKQFATLVIEVPRPSYHLHSKKAMQTTSRRGPSIGLDCNYSGPQRLCLLRWKYIHTFYVFDLSPENYYQAQSLTHHPHYSILRTEFEEYNAALVKFHSQHRSCKIKRISSNENFQDDFLIVINDFNKYPSLKKIVEGIADATLLSDLVSNGKLDVNRGNWRMDFGFASGQNLERDLGEFGMTRPRVLDRTREPGFLSVQKQLSQLLDETSKTFGLPLFHRVDGIHDRYAGTLQADGVYAAWRVAAHSSEEFVEVHEDALNDSRPLMSPVGVLSRIFQTETGPLRLSKIGYSRQSLLDSERRSHDLKPIIQEFLNWEESQMPIMKIVSNDLFSIKNQSKLPGIIQIPCHLDRCIGVSPYIHATIQLQKKMTLSRQQCVAILYNSVTNESPFFFYSVYEMILSFPMMRLKELSDMSPVEIGLWFHSAIWDVIDLKKKESEKKAVPRRHQPHNGIRTKDINISMSIMNLIRMTEQFGFLDGAEVKKQFPHSKAIAILMMPARGGGCHACGGLTSQTLLYTLACVGLIPICVTKWGELAGTETAAFLEREYNLTFNDGRSEQFLSCCVASSPQSTPEQIENKICKWIRSKKQDNRLVVKKQSSKKKLDHIDAMISPFRDGIWSGQSIYQPSGEYLNVWDGLSHRKIKPPAYDWPHARGKRVPSERDIAYWDQTTRSSRKRVLGANRRSRKSKVATVKAFTVEQCIILLPTDLEIVCQFTRSPLYLSINNLLACVLGESRSISNHRVFAKQKKGGKGFSFSVIDEHSEMQTTVDNTTYYRFAAECKADGALHFARERNQQALSKFVFQLVNSHQASKQLQGRERDGSGAYYLLHDNCRRTKGRREAIAVVRLITENRVLFAQLNEHYRSDQMSYCFLDR